MAHADESSGLKIANRELNSSIDLAAARVGHYTGFYKGSERVLSSRVGMLQPFWGIIMHRKSHELTFSAPRIRDQ